MKLYSSALFAMSSSTAVIGTQIQAVVKAAVLVVATEEEAEQAAMHICQQTWPAIEGYFNHTVSILEVSTEAMVLAQQPCAPEWNKYLTPEGERIQILRVEDREEEEEEDEMVGQEEHAFYRKSFERRQPLRLLKVEQSGA